VAARCAGPLACRRLSGGSVTRRRRGDGKVSREVAAGSDTACIDGLGLDEQDRSTSRRIGVYKGGQECHRGDAQRRADRSKMSSAVHPQDAHSATPRGREARPTNTRPEAGRAPGSRLGFDLLPAKLSYSTVSFTPSQRRLLDDQHRHGVGAELGTVSGCGLRRRLPFLEPAEHASPFGVDPGAVASCAKV
jgi:hypothetical protein